MKRILLLLLFISSFVYSQNLNMQTGSFTRCSGTLYDSGGSAGNYSDGESYTMTICPATPGTYVQLNFNSWGVEGEPFDFMTIYNGTGTGGTVIGTFGDTSPVIGACTTLTNQIASSHPSGCITITFVSDSSGQYAGWDATISCTSIAGGAAVSPPPITSKFCLFWCKPFLCRCRTFKIFQMYQELVYQPHRHQQQAQILVYLPRQDQLGISLKLTQQDQSI